jgi:hypothetical protein
MPWLDNHLTGKLFYGTKVNQDLDFPPGKGEPLNLWNGDE